jgi:hypothetical protein
MVEPANSILALSEIADETEGAVAFLAQTADTLRSLNRANVFCRFLLGLQLLVVQRRQLWSQIMRLVGDEQNATGGPYQSFEDFMAHGFQRITGLGQKTGYAAIMLAKSDAMQKLPEFELRNSKTLGTQSIWQSLSEAELSSPQN